MRIKLKSKKRRKLMINILKRVIRKKVKKVSKNKNRNLAVIKSKKSSLIHVSVMTVIASFCL